MEVVVLDRFSGTGNPEGWIYRAEQYFTFLGFDEEYWLPLPSFYLDGEALTWFNWLFRNKQFFDWKHFKEKFAQRFRHHSSQELVENPTRSKPTPVEFQRFCGENPELWIFQAEQYFAFYGIADNHKLSLASFYLDGEALEWYQWLFRNKQLADWGHFTAKVMIRFRKQHLESQRCRLANAPKVFDDLSERSKDINSLDISCKLSQLAVQDPHKVCKLTMGDINEACCSNDLADPVSPTIDATGCDNGATDEDTNDEEEIVTSRDEPLELVAAIAAKPNSIFSIPCAQIVFDIHKVLDGCWNYLLARQSSKIYSQYGLGLAQRMQEMSCILSACSYDNLIRRGRYDHFSALGYATVMLFLHPFCPNQFELDFPFDPGESVSPSSVFKFCLRQYSVPLDLDTEYVEFTRIDSEARVFDQIAHSYVGTLNCFNSYLCENEVGWNVVSFYVMFHCFVQEHLVVSIPQVEFDLEFPFDPGSHFLSTYPTVRRICVFYDVLGRLTPINLITSTMFPDVLKDLGRAFMELFWQNSLCCDSPYVKQNMIIASSIGGAGFSQTQLVVQLVEVDLPVGLFIVPGDPKMFVHILQSQVLDVIADSVIFVSNGGQLDLPDMVKKYSTHFPSYVMAVLEFEIAASYDGIKFIISNLLRRLNISCTSRQTQALIAVNRVVQEVNFQEEATKALFVIAGPQSSRFISIPTGIIDSLIRGIKCGSGSLKKFVVRCLQQLTDNSKSAQSISAHDGLLVALLTVCIDRGRHGELVGLAYRSLRHNVEVERIEEGVISVFIKFARFKDGVIRLSAIAFLQTLAYGFESKVFDYQRHVALFKVGWLIDTYYVEAVDKFTTTMSIMLNLNLEDKVLFEDGGIVMNDSGRDYKVKGKLGKWENYVWDPGGG